MRYHYEYSDYNIGNYGQLYKCDHPVYNYGTLYLVGDLGIVVIQQRYDPRTKHTWWGPVDARLKDDLYLNSGFERYVKERGGTPKNGLYPTVTIRQAMWALKMKPLRKEIWETTFDHRFV